jgi:hypothetical protein
VYGVYGRRLGPLRSSGADARRIHNTLAAQEWAARGALRERERERERAKHGVHSGMNACCQQVHSSGQVVDSRNYSSASLPRLRCPATTPADFLTLAPPAAAAAGGPLVVAAPPAAAPAAAAPLLAAWELGLVVEDEENMRSASRKRLIRRIAPLLACLPRYPSQPRKMLPSLTVSCSRTREKDRKKPREWSHDEEIARDSGWGRAGARACRYSPSSS